MYTQPRLRLYPEERKDNAANAANAELSRRKGTDPAGQRTFPKRGRYVPTFRSNSADRVRTALHAARACPAGHATLTGGANTPPDDCMSAIIVLHRVFLRAIHFPAHTSKRLMLHGGSNMSVLSAQHPLAGPFQACPVPVQRCSTQEFCVRIEFHVDVARRYAQSLNMLEHVYLCLQLGLFLVLR